MGFPRGVLLSAAGLGLCALAAGCSSGQDKASAGSLSVRLGLARTVADPPEKVAAHLTVSALEARRADGTWVLRECNPQATFDLVALAPGGTVTMPPHLLPEGQYDALQVRFDRVELTLQDGTLVDLKPPATGWTVLVPVDFGVAVERGTIVALNLRPEASFKLTGDDFRFEPDIVLVRVEHQ